MTIHHTLYAHNRLRSARTTGGGEQPPNLDFRNNVIYDWKEYATHTGSQPVYLNLVNNYYREGPSTGIEDPGAQAVIFTFMKDVPYRLFAAGNQVDGYPDLTRDNWQAIRLARSDRPHQYELPALRATREFPTPPVTTQRAVEAYQRVLADSGATLPARDAVDLRVIDDVRNRTGAVINFETDISAQGRWQTYHSLPAPLDSDGDGIPDYWEDQFGFDKHSSKDAMQDSDGDGYVNIEEYFNNTDPRGGTAPLVYISASISRVYSSGRDAGEFQIHRSGDLSAPLPVRYLLHGKTNTVIIPAGRDVVSVSAVPAADAPAVATLAAGTGYHLGCPLSAMVLREAGDPPSPVDIARVDPDGGVSREIHQIGDDNMKDHKKDKSIKHKTLYPQP
jgi:hypothetical protein